MSAARNWTTLAGTTLTALALAACGGGGAETAGDSEDFAVAADRICTEAAKRDIGTRHAATADNAAYLRQLQEQRRAAVVELAALTPPAELADRFDEYLSLRQQAATSIGDGIGAAEAEDSAAFEDFRSVARKRVLAAQRLAADLGLSACAGTLPASDRASIEAVIASSTDPSQAREFCREHVSEAMIAANFGSLSDCIREQSKRSATEAIRIDEFSGVAGVSADAIATLSTGDERAGTYEILLVEEGGSWRLDAVSPRQKP